MRHFGDIMFKDAVVEEQKRRGSFDAYAKMTAQPVPDELSDRERDFIAARDSFYLSSVSSDGWPYVQHRGGPKGFLKVITGNHLAFGDYRGNKQYVSTGHFQKNDRAALFLMDYPHRRRLKMLARVRVQSADENEELAARVDIEGSGKIERLFVLEIEAFDWNCPQFITPRFSEEEIRESFAPKLAELEKLQRENAKLKDYIETLGG